MTWDTPGFKAKYKAMSHQEAALPPFPRKTFLQAALAKVEKEVNVDKQLHDLFTIISFTKVHGRNPRYVRAMPSSLKVTCTLLPSPAVFLAPKAVLTETHSSSSRYCLFHWHFPVIM